MLKPRGSTFPIRLVAFAATLFLFTIPSFAQQASDSVAPETASGTATKQLVLAHRHMVVAANPLAAEAGLEVLRDGGNAADALVAVQAMLGLVEPQSSGLGGGAFLVWYDAKEKRLTTFDGRETAPAEATPSLFLDANGKPLPFYDAVVGGRSVGTPGTVRLLEAVHGKYGSKDWKGLFGQAIDLAEKGFAVSPRLHGEIAEDMGRLDHQPAARAYFYDQDGKPLAVGATLKNPAYAETLRAIASGGADAFYTGRIASDIVAAVRAHPTNPGHLSLQDLATYKAKERPAVCAPYRGYEVCGMGPPSSGALTIGQILGMISGFEIGTLGPDDPESWRIIGDATRLAFADRDRYMADSDFVPMPKGLLDQNYLKSRATLLRRPTALGRDDVRPGDPPWEKAELRIDGFSYPEHGTSHFVIVDDAGNIASMTTTIESAFGSRQMVDGFLLNNELTDFTFAPVKDGHAVANRVEPGKRPRSSMAPTIVLKDGKPVIAIGSPGGSNIISYVAEALIAMIDWKMDVQQAVSLPHFVNRFGTYDLEAETKAADMARDLQALGYQTKVDDQNSGLHGIEITPAGIEGGADPRREGVALGD
ncbi:MAG: gamma-glutamyltransferase [Rhizobiales bacterium]|jgi:gamma-glutamyltranspeptidase/glutathione hydrolase|nr:gamma-glutamyltransferase [Hyphomicrobiales bacterium]